MAKVTTDPATGEVRLDLVAGETVRGFTVAPVTLSGKVNTSKRSFTIRASGTYVVPVEPPPVEPPVEPPPVIVPPANVPPADLQAALNASSVGGVIDITGGTYSGSFTISHALTLRGAGTIKCASGNALTIRAADVTIDGVTLAGTGYAGIWAEESPRLHIARTTISGFNYVGIGLWACTAQLIEENHIHHIGPGDPANDNAYGIFNSSAGYNGIGSGVIRKNLVEYVTTWQGYNVHSADGLSFQDNIARNCRRGFWIATGSNARIRNVQLLRNRAESPLSTVAGDKQPFFTSATDNVTYDGNSMSPDWPAASTPDGGEFVAHIRDYGNASTGLVRKNTTVA